MYFCKVQEQHYALKKSPETSWSWWFSLRKQPAFSDANTGFPAMWRLMSECPQPSMVFLRSFLKRHFAGKLGVVSWNDGCFQRLLLLGLGKKKKKQKPWLLCCLSQSGLMLLQVSNMDPSLLVSAIGYFRVPKTLTFKMRSSAQHFLWNESYLQENEKSFLYQRLST